VVSFSRWASRGTPGETWRDDTRLWAYEQGGERPIGRCARPILATCNCTAAIAEGHKFKSFLDRIGLLEAEVQEAKVQLANMKPEGVTVRQGDIRHFAEARLFNIREPRC